MSEEKKVGIKETKEILEAVNNIAVDAIKAVKDGIGFEDISVILNNLEAIKVAVEGCTKVPEEFKDLDASEISELISKAVSMVFDIINAVKK